MQLLSIENLSLAAEATVILLLLAIAWHPRRKEPHHAQNGVEGISWEPAKYFYLQAFIHRGLYLQQWRETQSHNSHQSTDSKPFIPVVVDDDDNKPNMPAPWKDRLTRLLNRQGFDSILKEWLSIGQKHRGDSCLSMLTMPKYSEMVNAQGAMITEQALQRIATHLVTASSMESLVARYLPDRFVVLHFASTIASCRKAMEFVQKGMSEKEFFKVAGQPHALESIVSIVDLHGDSDIASRMDELEEGTIEAERSGRTIYSIAGGAWTDEGALNASAVTSAKSVDIDVSEAASADDISALFASVIPITDAVAPTVDNPIEQADLSEAATADDIASLFATVKSAVNPTGPDNDINKSGDQLSAEPSTSTVPTLPAGEELNEAASLDNIESKFAAMKIK